MRLEVTPSCRAFARFTQSDAQPALDDGPAPADLTRWLQANKFPLLAQAPTAPPWLTTDPAFRAGVAQEQAWYDTQHREYVVVREAWLAAGVDCLMIKSAGSYPSFPHTSDNIDILVQPEDGRVARDVLRRLGYVELRNIEEPRKFLFRKFHAGRCVSAIHVHERVGWLVGFMDEAALWARKRPAEDDPSVNVPSPEDAVLINLAHACYENKRLRFNDLARVRHAVRSAGDSFDWSYLKRVSAARGWLDGLAFMMVVCAGLEDGIYGQSLIPPAEAEWFERIAWRTGFVRRHLRALRSAGPLDLPLNLSFAFCKRLYYRKILSDPASTLLQRWRDVGTTLLTGLKLKSGVRPQPGMVVTLSGLDGAGKTAHARALVDALRLCEIKADYVWSRGGSTGLVGLATRLIGHGPSEGEHLPSSDHLQRRRQRLANPLARLAWSWLVAVDQIGTYLLRVRLPRLFGRVVVADRYVYDTAVEMEASLPPDDAWSRRAIDALLGLVPRPECGFVLDVTAETARSRKPGEILPSDLDRQRWCYRELAERFSLRVLASDGVFADANDLLIRQTINTYMAHFGTWLNALFLANPDQKNPPDAVWLRKGAR